MQDAFDQKEHDEGDHIVKQEDIILCVYTGEAALRQCADTGYRDTQRKGKKHEYNVPGFDLFGINTAINEVSQNRVEERPCHGKRDGERFGYGQSVDVIRTGQAVKDQVDDRDCRACHKMYHEQDPDLGRGDLSDAAPYNGQYK